ncbi:hypothetical protein F5B17DRAFT_427823 [Nemania serpens]|nr:hypothetical protein F5B17DRAFT_427823 [Nemania serpens]
MNGSHESLLAPLQDSPVETFPSKEFGFRKSNRPYHLAICALVITNLVSFVILLRRGHSQLPIVNQPFLSPADDAVQYETTYFDKYGHLTSPFSKEPGPELDAAWHQQLAGMNIRVSTEWLAQYGVESIPLADGSGVVAQLGVYHELHCLKKIKHWIYRSHYSGNRSDTNLSEEAAHTEHCLEWLRVAALCRGDTTLTTFQWSGERKGVLETKYPIPRRCVNHQSLLAWSEERAVDITEPGLLVPPPAS